MIKALDEKFFSKITKEGYGIIYWITSFLTLYFLIQLTINTLISTLTTGYSIVDSLISERVFNDNFTYYIIDYLVAIILSLIAFVFVLKLAKWSGKHTDIKIEKKKLFFITGIYLLIMNTINLFSYGVYIIVLNIQNSIDKYDYSISMPLFYIFINLLMPSLFIIVGIILIKKSQYLGSDLQEV